MTRMIERKTEIRLKQVREKNQKLQKHVEGNLRSVKVLNQVLQFTFVFER